MEKERTVKINSSTDLVINDVITFLRKKFPYKKFSKIKGNKCEFTTKK